MDDDRKKLYTEASKIYSIKEEVVEIVTNLLPDIGPKDFAKNIFIVNRWPEN